jgi:hypothetical protein
MFISGTKGSAAKAATRNPPQQTLFARSIVEALANEEFCALTNLSDRAAWAQEHGITRPITQKLVFSARAELARKKRVEEFKK